MDMHSCSDHIDARFQWSFRVGLEAIALRLGAIALRLEAIASRSQVCFVPGVCSPKSGFVPPCTRRHPHPHESSTQHCPRPKIERDIMLDEHG